MMENVMAVRLAINVQKPLPVIAAHLSPEFIAARALREVAEQAEQRIALRAIRTIIQAKSAALTALLIIILALTASPLPDVTPLALMWVTVVLGLRNIELIQ